MTCSCWFVDSTRFLFCSFVVSLDCFSFFLFISIDRDDNQRMSSDLYFSVSVSFVSLISSPYFSVFLCLSISVPLPLCPCVCLCVHLACLSACLSVRPSVYLYVCLTVSPSLSLSRSVCLSVIKATLVTGTMRNYSAIFCITCTVVLVVVGTVLGIMVMLSVIAKDVVCHRCIDRYSARNSVYH